MQKRKVERLNELDLDKPTAKVEKPAPAKVDDDRQKKEQEQKQLRSLIRKAEEKIGSLEARIAGLDSQLADPAQYVQLTADPAFFNSYNKLKKDLEQEMEKWETLSGKLEE